MDSDDKKFEWLDSNGEVNESLFREGTFPKDYDGPVYVTPDWIRHPERYPELTERMSESTRGWLNEMEESKK